MKWIIIALLFASCVAAKPTENKKTFEVSKVVLLKDGYRRIYAQSVPGGARYTTVCQCDTMIKGKQFTAIFLRKLSPSIYK